jgi:hypothetical protein
VRQNVLGLEIIITHQLESLPGGGTRWHTRIRIETPLPDGPGHPDAKALVQASPAGKWHPNIVRMLGEEISSLL